MLRAVLLFITADALGEAARRLLILPISGPMLGMVLLFALFARRGSVPATVEETGRRALRLLPLFFVPAGVGAVQHAALIARCWPAIVLALTGSSLAALLVTGFTLRVLERGELEERAVIPARQGAP